MKRKILVLEDEENIRSFLVLNLKRSGYEVIEAETGEIALEKYHENQDIAVAVLDVMLPGMSGFEIMEKTKDVPVIFVTAKGELNDKLHGLSIGAEDYIVKPFEILELIARINVVLRRAKKMMMSLR